MRPVLFMHTLDKKEAKLLLAAKTYASHFANKSPDKNIRIALSNLQAACYDYYGRRPNRRLVVVTPMSA